MTASFCSIEFDLLEVKDAFLFNIQIFCVHISRRRLLRQQRLHGFAEQYFLRLLNFFFQGLGNIWRPIALFFSIGHAKRSNCELRIDLNWLDGQLESWTASIKVVGLERVEVWLDSETYWFLCFSLKILNPIKNLRF